MFHNLEVHSKQRTIDSWSNFPKKKKDFINIIVCSILAEKNTFLLVMNYLLSKQNFTLLVQITELLMLSKPFMQNIAQ